MTAVFAAVSTSIHGSIATTISPSVLTMSSRVAMYRCPSPEMTKKSPRLTVPVNDPLDALSEMIESIRFALSLRRTVPPSEPPAWATGAAYPAALKIALISPKSSEIHASVSAVEGSELVSMVNC